jgi:mannose-6-phosphate isomerase
LTEVINEVPNEILGTEVYKRFGKQFLTFKYLDAREDLSFKYILTMLWQRKTQFFWKNRNVVYHAADEG